MSFKYDNGIHCVVILVFDLDGTIVDSWDEIVTVFTKVFERWGIDLDLKRLRMAVGFPLATVIEKTAGFYDADLEKEIKKEFYRLNPRKIKMYPGMDKVLRHPAKKAVLTSKRRRGTINDLEFLGIRNLFSVVVTAEDLKHPKPHPEGVMRIIKAIGDDGVYLIGDTEIDILTAKNAGVMSIAVTWGFRSKEFLKRYDPDYLVDRAEEILKIIERDEG